MARHSQAYVLQSIPHNRSVRALPTTCALVDGQSESAFYAKPRNRKGRRPLLSTLLLNQHARPGVETGYGCTALAPSMMLHQLRSSSDPVTSSDNPSIPHTSEGQKKDAEFSGSLFDKGSENADGNVGSGNGHSDGNGNHSRGGDGQGSGDGWSSNSDSTTRLQAFLGAVSNAERRLGQDLSRTGSVLSETLQHIFKTVPAQVLVAFIGIVSGFFASKRKGEADKRAAEKTREEKARQNRLAVERKLRERYDEFHGPLLKAAVKLSERLYLLVNAVSNEPRWSDDDEPYPASTYTAYLLGRYLACVEQIKRESQVLDMGFPAADRIFVNILGRIQAMLAADSDTLIRLQHTEHYFQPARGAQPVPGGPFRVAARTQASIGELMLRTTWTTRRVGFHSASKARTDYTEVDAGRGRTATAHDAHAGGGDLLTFVEFMHLLRTDQEMQRWLNPVIRNLKVLERKAKKTRAVTRRYKARSDGNSVGSAREDGRALVGSRLYFVQSALQDLVEFLDPLPRNKFARPGLRRRLRLGGIHHGEEQRMPPSMHVLYSELADMRDHRMTGPKVGSRVLNASGEMEVFVKAPQQRRGSDWRNRANRVLLKNEMGDCPYSQRVLIALEELGIRYRLVDIPLDAKPSWFHMMHPESTVPVLYHRGRLVESSRHILGYLIETFPQLARENLAPTQHLRLGGTMSLTRFYPRFRAALRGSRGGKALKEYREELFLLEDLLARIGKEQEGPFIGGKRFSREDTALAPLLHRASVAGPAVRGEEFEIPKECLTIRRYLEEAKKVESFVKTTPTDATTIAGFEQLARSKHICDELVWLSDALE